MLSLIRAVLAAASPSLLGPSLLQEGSEAESGERVAAVVGEMSEEVEEFVPQSSLAHQDEEHF